MNFLSRLKYFSVVWLLLKQRVNWPPGPVALAQDFLKSEKSLAYYRCSSLRQCMNADASRMLPSCSSTSLLLCFPKLGLGGAEICALQGSSCSFLGLGSVLGSFFLVTGKVLGALTCFQQITS